VWVTSSIASALTPTAVALGNFDGIHRGHQQVIQPILQASGASPAIAAVPPISSRQERRSEREHLYATVATFDPHPREFFSGERWQLLTPQAEKVQQLSRLGIEQLVLLPFDRELAALSPEEFVKQILVEQLQAKRVSVGEDFRFGHKRAGTAADLRAIASAYGVEVAVVPLYAPEDERISSSSIRQSLQQGDIIRANHLLGRSYTLIGTVVEGQRLGRSIGFPTANLQIPSDKLLPKKGVYCGRVTAPSLSLPPSCQLAVLNIGDRPTVDGTRLTVEVHLLNWSGDLYGRTLTVSLEQFLRSEQKFASLDALKTQIQADCIAARNFFQSQE
jgi:riboflavin kinase/FMN adenylyltransferase